jgi:aryl-alcohol dehydrogenase-like predicted oxidoreductase
VAVLGLGLAALGRPGYLNVGHGDDIGPDRSVVALQRRCHEICDRAWASGIRWFDAARSYGLAEEFLAAWLRSRAIQPDEVTVSSKWGYTYTAGWQDPAEVEVNEVKDHSVETLQRQWRESDALLGPWLRWYQVHSATEASGVLDDRSVHTMLAGLPVAVGLSVTGPDQADVLRRALDISIDGQQLFSAVQATWNVLEPSAAAALAEAKDAGWTVIIKEALANGRLADRPVEALAAALAQPWADVVLSGAVTVEQLDSNVGALEHDDEVSLEDLHQSAMDPDQYWAERSALPWT